MPRREAAPGKFREGGRIQTICSAEGRVAELKAAGKPKEPGSCSLAGLCILLGVCACVCGTQRGLLKDDFIK